MREHNKITWEYDRLEGEDAIWKGTTSLGAVFYGVKKDHEIKDITLYSTPKTPRVTTVEELKIKEAREALLEVDANSLFIMYDKHSHLSTYDVTDNWEHIDHKEGRLYGWTVVGVLDSTSDESYLYFHISICNKKDKFCKKIGVVEALKNTEVLSMYVSNASHKELNSIFVNTVQSVILPRFQKKFKRRF